ncbi:MAG: TonB-dependent receptor plug domain-containing protein [Cyanobacteriota bacterium]
MKKNIFTLSFLLALSITNSSYAADLEEDLLDIPINLRSTVASKNVLSLKKAPGIITILTDEDILKSGVRDLQELLNLVPGFIFNTDVQGVVSTGFRGIWAEEGRCLVIIDGQEMNDILWPTIVFGNHFPVHQIKKVEILRGPGSAIYGGQAELAVINITTKTGKDMNGLSAKINAGSIFNDFNAFTKRNLNISYGQQFGDLDVSFHGTVGRGNLSDKTFTDFYNQSYSMKGNSENNPLFMNLGLSFKDFSARFISDIYRRTYRDGLANIIPDSIGAVPINHDGYYAELKYDFKPTSNFTLTPKLNYKRQFPWQTDNQQARKLAETKGFEANFIDKMVERTTGNLTANWDITKDINLITGGEFYSDYAKSLDPLSSNFGKDKKQDSIRYNNMAGFAQALYKNKFFNLTLGSRVENHSEYGLSFVPRAAITGNYEAFHAKLLYSKAFRSPGIQNIINFDPEFSKSKNIKPENATVSEIELGYDITPNMEINANLFDTNIQDPIIYFTDKVNAYDAYDNFERTGSRGFELEYKIKDEKIGYANLTYSFNMANENKVDVYAVPSRKDILLGFPFHKVTLNTSLNLFDNLSINPSLVFIGNRFGYNSADKDGKPVVKEFAPNFLVNLNLLYKNLFIKGMDASLSVHNLLNDTYYFIQPYDGFHAPLPGASTEISLNLGYNFDIK